MGEVYRALRPAPRAAGRAEAAARRLADDDGFRERLLRESRLAASLDHPNVVPIYEAGEADGRLFIAMRYVDGTDLKALLRREGALAPRGRSRSPRRSPTRSTRRTRAASCTATSSRRTSSSTAGRARARYLADFGLTQSVARPRARPTGS